MRVQWVRQVILFFAIVGAAASASAEEGVAFDKNGREFRTGFPLYNRGFLEAGSHYGQALSTEVRGALVFSLAADYPDEGVWWELRHRILVSSYRSAGPDSILSATLLDADYLRHDLHSFVVIPGEQDWRLPTPFDLGFTYELGTLEISEAGLGWDVDRIRAGGFGLLLDFVRDPAFRHRLGVGALATYDIKRAESGWENELTPLSAARVYWGWDSESGRFSTMVDATCGYAISINSKRWSGSCGAQGRLEWTFLAINDHPIALVNEVGGNLEAEGVELSVKLALRVSQPFF